MVAFIVAIILCTLLFPIGILVTMFYPKRNNYFFKIAVSLDQLGNVVCARLFNLTLIHKAGYKFGNEDETISSVLGKNKRAETLTILGKLLDNLLEVIDRNHSIEAIEEEEI